MASKSSNAFFGLIGGRKSKAAREKRITAGQWRNVEPGDLIKAMFTRRGETERMWVKVIKVTKSGIVGLLDNEPVVNTQLHLGERVTVPWSKITERSSNPAKFDRCVRDVKKSAKKYGRPVNAYAVCTAAGTRNPKTKLDLILDRVAAGKGEVTFDVRDGYSPEQVQRIIDTAEARGLNASSDGKYVLVRDLRGVATRENPGEYTLFDQNGKAFFSSGSIAEVMNMGQTKLKFWFIANDRNEVLVNELKGRALPKRTSHGTVHNPAGPKLPIYSVSMTQAQKIPQVWSLFHRLAPARRAAEKEGSEFIAQVKDSQLKHVGYLVPYKTFTFQMLDELVRQPGGGFRAHENPIPGQSPKEALIWEKQRREEEKRESEHLEKLEKKHKGNPIQDPNSSGQGYDPDHAQVPYAQVLEQYGYRYSHSTPVVHTGNERVIHHTWKKGKEKWEGGQGVHNVSSYNRSGVWKWDAGTSGSGHGYSGNSLESLEKYLKGRKKKGNPESSAASMYESFHGEPSKEIVEFQEEEHYHSNLGGVGTLVELRLLTTTGYDVRLHFSKPETLVAESNPQKWAMPFKRGKKNYEDIGYAPYYLEHDIGFSGKKIYRPVKRDGQYFILKGDYGMSRKEAIDWIKTNAPKSESNPGKFGGSPYRGEWKDLNKAQKDAAYYTYKQETGDHISYGEFINMVADYIDWDTRTGKPWGVMSFGEVRSNPGIMDWIKGKTSKTTVYHVPRNSPKMTKAASYKGYEIFKDLQGAMRVPQLERESAFDTVAAAKKFIDHWTRVNPGGSTAWLVQYTILGKNYSVGFSTKEAAERAADKLAKAGRSPKIVKQAQVKSNPTLSPTLLTSNETGTQLYLTGGDQSIDLDSIHMGEKDGVPVKDSMVIGEAYFVSYFTQKSFDDFEPIIYEHDLAEESDPPSPKYRKDEDHTAKNRRELGNGTGLYPTVRYDTLNQKLYLDGGMYKIDLPLMGVSPGIEN